MSANIGLRVMVAVLFGLLTWGCGGDSLGSGDRVDPGQTVASEQTSAKAPDEPPTMDHAANTRTRALHQPSVVARNLDLPPGTYSFGGFSGNGRFAVITRKEMDDPDADTGVVTVYVADLDRGVTRGVFQYRAEDEIEDEWGSGVTNDGSTVGIWTWEQLSAADARQSRDVYLVDGSGQATLQSDDPRETLVHGPALLTAEYVAWFSDNPGRSLIIRNRKTGATEVVKDVDLHLDITPNANTVAFEVDYEVILVDRTTGDRRVIQTVQDTDDLSISVSPDGTHVLIASRENLTGDDDDDLVDLFLYDVESRQLSLVEPDGLYLIEGADIGPAGNIVFWSVTSDGASTLMEFDVRSAEFRVLWAPAREDAAAGVLLTDDGSSVFTGWHESGFRRLKLEDNVVEVWNYSAAVQ